MIEIQPSPQGRYSTHMIDFGQEIGTKKSLAKLAPNHESREVVGGLVLCVVNFPPLQIGKHQSEVLTLGVPDENGNVVLLRPDRNVPLGGSCIEERFTIVGTMNRLRALSAIRSSLAAH